ncbi:SH3 domain-containing protein [Rhizorhabdus dicambivorans]|uniref:SH3 domain-containing protein n=1 Tax=Rhizorhabdus dicambivorans TaxID=1850238 RepID=A0A2A4FWV1_9SPHN|nr:SH3 domain-containing protein [Rhizorhabdus dicambivorans]ATE63100.1 SH3 domain-containing protein [Rhizorhabdus dicambivorans]PCE43276.1 SH3 domain-containing protein [Rhizorhabdus dicambivorans]
MKYLLSAAMAAALLSTQPAFAADAPVALAKCDKPIGAIAVVDGDTQGWTKYGLSSPRDLIAAMAVQSGCFTLANNSGTPADFLVTAIAGDKEEVDKGTSLAKTALTEGLVRSGAAGRMMGNVPFAGQALSMFGGFGGKKKTVAAGLKVISPATGQVIAAGTAEQTKTVMSFGGAGLVPSNPWGDAARAQMAAMGYGDPYAVGGSGGYGSSKDGQMLATAFVGAFNNVVAQQAALVAVKPAAAAAAAAAAPVATKPGYTTAIDTKLYAGPAKGETVRALRAGTSLTPTGVREGLFVEVSDAYGTKGWVSVEDLK